jgi:hypothetical protein
MGPLDVDSYDRFVYFFGSVQPVSLRTLVATKGDQILTTLVPQGKQHWSTYGYTKCVVHYNQKLFGYDLSHFFVKIVKFISCSSFPLFCC